ncbi:hypothetical protein [Escherichia phage KW1E_UTAR]|nr:hypothetical protein [Escherichia phage KW1E_UTAR]
MKALFWIVVFGLLFLMAGLESNSRRERCEVDMAKQLHSEAIYQHGECIVKGWGKVRL